MDEGVHASGRGDTGRLWLAILAKSRSDFGYCPAPDTIHADTAGHLAVQLGVAVPEASADKMRRTKSLYRYQVAVRSYLNVRPYDDEAERLVIGSVLETTETISDPADLIKRAVEALNATATDLPAFSTLDRLVSRLLAGTRAAEILDVEPFVAMNAWPTSSSGPHETASGRARFHLRRLLG